MEGFQYHDEAPEFAARELASCFTIAQVRETLGQDPPPESHSTDRTQVIAQLRKAGVDFFEDLVPANSENHYLPGCICSKFHVQCDSQNPSTPPTPPTKAWFSFEDLQRTSKAGCWFCSIILGGIKASPPWDAGRSEPTLLNKGGGIWLWAGVGASLFSVQDPNLIFYIQAVEGSQSKCESLRAQREFPDPNPLSCLTEYALPSLQECRQSHACKNSGPATMPTRLLDVSIVEGKYTIKVFEPKETGIVAPYVTLSHCWGKTKLATTTASNLQQMKENIPWSELSQTFRDAIAVTHFLGYQYLWIGGLCIIQGDRADFEIESARMNDIFSNCDLMLSADRAGDENAGLFTSSQLMTKSWAPQVSKETQYGTRVRFHKCHKTFGIELPMFANEAENHHIFPLNRRAWCLQERLMAPRILHFGIDELHWECRYGAHCQCGTFGPRGTKVGTAKMQFERLRRKPCTMEEKSILWLNFCGQYSERLLTNWTDRMPAFSGLAKQFVADNVHRNHALQAGNQLQLDSSQHYPFSQIDLGDYLAGHWSRTLATSLRWLADYNPRERVVPYVAPSWSWTSVQGRLEWRTAGAAKIEIHHASCKPDGLDPHGTVSGGQLEISANIIPLKLFSVNRLMQGGSWISCEHVRRLDPDTREDSFLGFYRPDALPQAPSDYEFVSYDHKEIPTSDLKLINDKIFGVLLSDELVLCLERDTLESTFTRIGMIISESSPKTSDKATFFKDSPRRRIIII